MNQKQIQQMMKQAQKLQDQVEGAQDELNKKEFTTTTGGGAVEVIMTGNKKLVSLNIKEEIIDPEDKDMLEEMIVSCINQSIDAIEKETEETIGAYTKGLPF